MPTEQQNKAKTHKEQKSYPNKKKKNPNLQDSTIVLFKMFSRRFFANKRLIITLRTSKFGDVM